MSHSSDIRALIHLIDDPDDTIYLHVRDRLMNYGLQAVPALEDMWAEKDFGLVFLSRIEELIHDIQFSDTKEKLQQWAKKENNDLFEGALIVTKYQYPNLDETDIYHFLSTLKKDIAKELSHRQSALEKVRSFNRIFFEQYRFHGDSKDFHSPLNSYMHTVIESRKGNPLSLGIIYCVIAQALKLPIYGVNLPNHFILAYVEKPAKRRFSFWDKIWEKKQTKHNVLFYINPFSNGELFDEQHISSFLQNLNLPLYNDYFEPCTNQDIIRRMFTNLIGSFQLVGNKQRVKELSDLRDILS